MELFINATTVGARRAVPLQGRVVAMFPGISMVEFIRFNQRETLQ
jgi:hypothetical protein